ncbi:hypothetical protein A1O7_06910 [Cladophialophora yegresii CBS 114405]|uniref:Uncharacterized protein n=1 Tax=Cladophialophora yegresii CBS 114405 TaxID=1182544 RepID=W9VWG6_9EURO|nr:uncharacterized protein A1O7_06910 [Cladophialophora yegresii CBS 114405]EXJ56566.1 hypothetical protein A1O7_06910 [Cladophialophora yegresii CBS 114405]
MAPGEHELLVHITASSTALDDKRYVAMARSVLEFRPAIITRVSECEPLPAPILYSHVNIQESDGSAMIRDSSPLAATFRPDPGRSGRAVSPAIFGRKRKQLPTKGTDSECMDRVVSGNQKQHNRDASCSSKHHEVARSGWVVSATGDAESTQSVSPSHKPSQGGPRKQGDEPHKSPDPSVVDLTTPERRASCSHPTPTSSPVQEDPFQSPPTPVTTSTEIPTACYSRATEVEDPTHHPLVSTITPIPPFGNRVRQRPDEVRPLPEFLPQRSKSSFTTHITDDLDKFTPQMHHFRPACVARDVKVLERGYWQFWVRLVEKLPKPTLKLLGSTARRKHNVADNKPPKHALWTTDEFVKAWENVARTIELGKVGWGTWIAKDSADDSLWRIRVFTWGETLAHIWFMLFWQSNKLTGMVTMHWIATDGQAVVQMTPGTNLRGCWERKGADGAHGVWGFTRS